MATPIRWSDQFLVNSTTYGLQNESTAATLPDGRFVIVWADNFEIRGQMFNADGSRSGTEFPGNTTIDGSHTAPTVTALPHGQFVVAWTNLSQTVDGASEYSIKSQIFNPDGTKLGVEFTVNTATGGEPGYRTDPVITTLADGNFVVAWTDYSHIGGDTSGRSVHAQVFHANGSKLGAEFLVNTTTANDQLDPSITALPDGRFVIAFQGVGPDGFHIGIQGQAFNADGSKSGGEFFINTNSVGFTPSIAALTDGRLIVTWTGTDDGGSSGIRGQVLNADGSKSGAEFIVNTTMNTPTGGYQAEPIVTALSDGRFIVAWIDDSEPDPLGPPSPFVGQAFDVRAQVFNADGTPSGAEFVVNTNSGKQFQPTITALSDGRFVIAWTERSPLGDDVLAQIFKLVPEDDNRAPVTVNDGVAVAEDASTSGDVLANDTDPNGQPLSVTSVNGLAISPGGTAISGTYGTLTIKSDGTYSYAADAAASDALAGGQQVTETFTYVASDGSLADDAALTFTLTGVNNDPDIFEITSLKPKTVIRDFDTGDEAIYLENSVFKGLGTGVLKERNFAANEDGDATKKVAQIIYDEDSGRLFYDRDGTGHANAVHFATLKGAPDLSRFDFDLI